MKPEHEILNQIKWDKRLRKEDYTICYLDFGKIKEIPYNDIKRIEEGFMTIEKDGQETEIPLHRIRIIKKKGEIIWQR